MLRIDSLAVSAFVGLSLGIPCLHGQTPVADVLPIFKSSCANCHNASVKQKGLDLSTEESAMKGSESGSVVTPGKPDDSLLYQEARSGSMPVGKPHLSEQELAAIKTWIEGLATVKVPIPRIKLPSPNTMSSRSCLCAAQSVTADGVKKEDWISVPRPRC